MNRTVIDFRAGDVWPTVRAWATDNGYRMVERTPAGELYQKGAGLLVAPMMFLIRSDGDGTHIETWVRCNLFMRIMSMFMLPAEIGIQSGGFKAVLPRSIARGAVNNLLARIGQPQIQ